MNEKNIAAAFATSLSISLFIAAFVDPCILRYVASFKLKIETKSVVFMACPMRAVVPVVLDSFHARAGNVPKQVYFLSQTKT